jgi:hypothetical protein
MHLRTVRPTLKAFEFQAQGDGEFWFAVAAADDRGRLYPDIKELAPDVKVVVDTAAPTVEVQPNTADANRAGISWRVEDAHLDLESLKVLVRGEQDSAWRELRVSRRANGSVDWPVMRDRGYTARVVVRDRAGNENSAQIDVPPTAIGVDDQPDASPLSLPPASHPSVATSANQAREFPVDSQMPIYSLPPQRVAALVDRDRTAAPSAEFLPVRPPIAPHRAVSRSVSSHAEPWPPIERTSTANPSLGGREPAIFPLPTESIGSPSASRIPVAKTHGGMMATAGPAGPVDGTERIPLVGQRSFAINYQLRNVGPAGVGKVELYYTQDHGQTWRQLGEDPDCVAPFEVNVPKDGRYGFQVVVSNAAGWHRPPKPGDQPQLLVEVDTAAPQAELYEPVPDPSGTDALLVSWSARDAHLGERPVSLYYSESRDGQKKPIQSGLPANGQLRWQIPPGIHYRVFLFLVAEDLCGNSSMAATPESLLVDFSRPEAVVTSGDVALLPQNANR